MIIHRYTLTLWIEELLTSTVLEMPIGSKVLTAQYQPAKRCISLWAAIPDASTEMVNRFFWVFGTDWPIEGSLGGDWKYIATVQQDEGVSVWHVFEKMPQLG